MHLTLHRAVVTLAAAAALGAPLAALDKDKWSKVENTSGDRMVVTISDRAKTVGTLYVRKAGDKGDGVALAASGNTTTMDPKSSYEFYFYTNKTTQIALKFKVAPEKSPKDTVEFRVSNIGSSLGAKEKLSIWATDLNKSKFVLDPSGYRNSKGETFLTFK